jgi:hypothetical protein
MREAASQQRVPRRQPRRIPQRQFHRIYISVNAIRPQRKARTRDAIGEIRHVFLDADREGEQIRRAIGARRDVPAPCYVLQSSPNRAHILWRVAGFTREGVEVLQKQLARELKTDTAATSCAQLTRLPGFLTTTTGLRQWSSPNMATPSGRSSRRISQSWVPSQRTSPRLGRGLCRPVLNGVRSREHDGTSRRSRRRWPASMATPTPFESAADSYGASRWMKMRRWPCSANGIASASRRGPSLRCERNFEAPVATDESRSAASSRPL